MICTSLRWRSQNLSQELEKPPQAVTRSGWIVRPYRGLRAESEWHGGWLPALGGVGRHGGRRDRLAPTADHPRAVDNPLAGSGEAASTPRGDAVGERSGLREASIHPGRARSGATRDLGKGTREVGSGTCRSPHSNVVVNARPAQDRRVDPRRGEGTLTACAFLYVQGRRAARVRPRRPRTGRVPCFNPGHPPGSPGSSPHLASESHR